VSNYWGRYKYLVALWRDKNRESAEVKRIALEHVAGLEAKIDEMRAMSADHGRKR